MTKVFYVANLVTFFAILDSDREAAEEFRELLEPPDPFVVEIENAQPD